MENIRNEMNVSNNQSNDNNPHELEATAPGIYKVIRRNGKVTRFDATKIKVAITKAFLAVEGKNAAASSRIHNEVDKITRLVTGATTRNMPNGGAIHIEDIQDHVELALMRAGYQKIARSYVLYREQRAAERKTKTIPKGTGDSKSEALEITLENGEVTLLDETRLITIIKEACEGLEETDASAIFAETKRSLFPGVAEKDVANAVAMSARTFIEKEPNYTFVAARLLLDNLRTEVLTELNGTRTEATQKEMTDMYSGYFHQFIKKSIELELLDPRLGNFDLERLGAAIKPERDFNFNYLGMQTLYDRYFIKNLENRIELPQAFFMRVAMGLAINEIDPEKWSIKFYDLLSSFDFMSSTPTLFNSGTLRPQLSSCYLTTVPDDLDGIFNAIKDDALLSKYAGGLGNDWTSVRAMGAQIKGTNGKSQGVVPFLKVANDTAVAVNQGGKEREQCAHI